MLFYGRAQKIALFCVDTATGIGKTGDVSNLTLNVSKDGAANASASNTPTEIGYGLYSLELTASECSADLVCVSGVSSTSGVSISPIIATTEAQAIPYAVAGAASGLALTSSVSAVETKIDTLDTVADGIATTLGTSGAGLTDLGGFSTAAQAEINAEADAALADYDAPTKAEMDDAFTAVKGATFDTSTDSLEAIRNRGDSSWLTATGFSTHSAADVWAVGTRTLSAFGFSVDVTTIESGDATTALETAATASLNSYDGPTKSEMDDAFTAVKGSTFDTSTDSLEAIRNNCETATGFNTVTPPTAAAISDAVWDEVQSGHTTSGTFGYYLDAQVSSAAAPPTAAAIADAVWDELTSAHTGSGSYGKAIGDGISDWVTASGFSTFDPSSDTVGNVTTVGSVSGTVSADVVSVSGDSTAATNLEADYDGTGYAKTNSTIGTTTTNTDMRGTNSAFLAASAPTNFGDLAITASTGRVTVGTNSDKTGYSISGTLQTLDALNNFDPAADTVANVTTAGTVTNGVTVSTVSDGAIGADAVADIWSTTAIAESYASDGSTGTPAQLLYMIQQATTEFAISGTSLTVKKVDGSTTAGVWTLDDASAPTSRTRAS